MDVSRLLLLAAGVPLETPFSGILGLTSITNQVDSKPRRAKNAKREALAPCPWSPLSRAAQGFEPELRWNPGLTFKVTKRSLEKAWDLK